MLKGLSMEQYDIVFDMLLENAKVQDIQIYIMKNIKN